MSCKNVKFFVKKLIAKYKVVIYIPLINFFLRGFVLIKSVNYARNSFCLLFSFFSLWPLLAFYLIILHSLERIMKKHLITEIISAYCTKWDLIVVWQMYYILLIFPFPYWNIMHIIEKPRIQMSATYLSLHSIELSQLFIFAHWLGQ